MWKISARAKTAVEAKSIITDRAKVAEGDAAAKRDEEQLAERGLLEAVQLIDKGNNGTC